MPVLFVLLLIVCGWALLTILGVAVWAHLHVVAASRGVDSTRNRR